MTSEFHEKQFTFEEIVKTPLDATQKSTLNWQESIALAEAAIKKEKKILWELDFGLFDRLLHPLSHSQQFLSLCLGIEHFHQIIWPSFQDSTFGVSLYKGLFSFQEISEKIQTKALQDWIQARFDSIEDFQQETGVEANAFNAIDIKTLQDRPKTRFMASLFCRDVALDYIKQLAGQLPHDAEAIIQLDVDDQLSPMEKLIFFNEECFRPLLYKFDPYLSETPSQLGICLPPMSKFSSRWNRQLDQAINELLKKQLAFRPIAEEALITNLEGLDDLIVCPSAISYQGKRQLQGFCAAGGRVLLLADTSLGLPNELLFEDWVNEPKR